MKSKKIYLIRHGETEYNKLGMVQGSGIDSNLNETGQKQARAFYEYYKGIPFDKVYTSKLRRTHQSVQQFIDSKLPWQQLYGLNEISWGHKEGRQITDEDNEQYANMLIGWTNGDYTQKVYGGESPLEVQERQRDAWRYILANDQEENILVCMHGRAIRILLCLLLDIELKNMDRFIHSNLCLYLLNYEDGKFSIEKECDVTHLKKLPQYA
ncbi:MAG: histidine phosphatase family protein [Thalassobius sp.]|nr:histidine phosphatase family protein [Thalassovita sp.]